VANTNPITLQQLFRFSRGLPHQLAAISQLEDDIAANGYAAAMRRDRNWFKTWSQDGMQYDLAPALNMIKKFEGVRLDAYPDPGTGGDPWTIGFGNTRYTDGRPVRRGDRINMIEADMMLRHEVDRIAAVLGRQIPHWGELTSNQKCALISFAYNCGTGFYGTSGFGTISRCLAEKRWADVPKAFMLYVNPGSSVEVGLRRRREAEGKLWAAGAGPQLQQGGGVRLAVPYEAQNDNASGTGYRECFSSSCAMIARFYGKVANDDAYNLVRAKFGDSTDANAQVRALASLGLNARFIQDGTPELLERELTAGRPVAVGWLHYGPVTAPSGGGHWTVAIGFNPTQFIHNDPNGAANLVAGGYPNNQGGDGVAYSRKNWLPRWMPNGSKGWAILASKA
jgi:GH24 family phage-related lysozyme (muramidase)